MLVLTRACGEQVVVNDNVVITVVSVRGGRVRLSFDAPRDVPVYRREVYDAIKREERGETGQP